MVWDGTDPVVLIKMVLIQHLFGIPSLRQTYREIQLNVAYRWFLGYRCNIEYYIKPQLGDKQIPLISQQDIQRMYRRLKTEGRIHEHPERDQQLSDSMVCHIHSTLHAALKDAVQAHVIPRNPTEGTTVPKPNYKPKRILTRAELDAFLAVVEQDEVWRDFFQTELITDLRRSEICGLQWSDFDGDTGTLKVCRTLHSQRKGEYTVGETKTNQGMRTIILPHSVTEILRRRRADAISQWIFPDPVKPENPVDPNVAYRHMKMLLQRAGLPSICAIPSRPTLSPAVWTSRRCPASWVTPTPASRWTPTPMSPQICRSRPVASWAASWKTSSGRS